jgi:hypothetical protein
MEEAARPADSRIRDREAIGLCGPYDAAIVLPGQTLPVVFDTDKHRLWMGYCHNVCHAMPCRVAVAVQMIAGGRAVQVAPGLALRQTRQSQAIISVAQSTALRRGCCAAARPG